LDQLNCRYLQLRLFTLVDERYLIQLTELNKYGFKGIELLLARTNFSSLKISIEMLTAMSNMNQIVIHSDSEVRRYELNGCSVVHTTKSIDSETHCGAVSTNDFTANRALFTENHHFNSCLNNKVSIDHIGQICNCPSLPEKYGSIGIQSIADALTESTSFKKYWTISKDQIEVCQTCEFRYICTDCRAYREDPKELYSKPLKCGYDPNTGVWEDWKKSPFKQNAIQFYDLK
ncbi:MAG: grasp-with-spasm system SPASM domain peptide maturase, partial [Bacteroidota bacterium]